MIIIGRSRRAPATLTAAIDAVDAGRSDEFVDPDIDQVRAIEKAIKTARLIREKNLPTS
ncbi:MAG: hypothetical protein XD69_0730 [Clostridia bacterium 62_21]|nr:MAG: hypothetical protein XD69_0730 [Clostridia bacterium 62_21]